MFQTHELYCAQEGLFLAHCSQGEIHHSFNESRIRLSYYKKDRGLDKYLM